MICSICDGEVQWQGPLSSLTHTKCLSCGATNSQKRDEQESFELEVDDYALGEGLVLCITPDDNPYTPEGYEAILYNGNSVVCRGVSSTPLTAIKDMILSAAALTTTSEEALHAA